MRRSQLLLILLISVLVASACSQSDTQSTNSSPTTKPLQATSQPPTTLASATTATSQAVTSSVPSTIQPSQSEVSDCPSPSPTTEDDSDEYVRLHIAVEQLLASTNQLGTALLGIDDFAEGWETSEQVRQVVDTIHVDLDALEAEAAAILAGTFGATFDQEGMWWQLSLIHISEPTRRATISRMPSSA